MEERSRGFPGFYLNKKACIALEESYSGRPPEILSVCCLDFAQILFNFFFFKQIGVLSSEAMVRIVYKALRQSRHLGRVLHPSLL